MSSKSYNIFVEGMHCASCVSRVEKSLKLVSGIEDANANFANGSVKIFSSSVISSSKLVEAIGKVGYQLALEEIPLKISDLIRESSVEQIERVINKEPSVIANELNLTNNLVKVTFLRGIAPIEKIVEAIKKIGFEAVRIESVLESRNSTLIGDSERIYLKQKLVLSILLTLPVFSIEMSSHLFPQVDFLIEQTIGHHTSHIIQFLLTTILLLGPGNVFLKTGFQALWRLSPDMNSLVAIGTTSAWGYSVVSTFVPRILPTGTAHVYFESAAVIITLILFGRYLESKAKGVANNAIQQLVDLTPRFAIVVSDGEEIEIPVSKIESGMIVKVKPGEKISVDGVVEAGETYVDDSLITGEPVPKHKRQGDKVIGGTVNQSGSINVKATSVGSDSVISHIIQLVRDAQATKLPIQALVDRVTAWFVPTIIGISMLTFFIWLVFAPDPSLNYAVVTAVAVLIIACPCAMGLATPTSIIVGTGKAANLGILFRNGNSLEQLRRVTILALDKTGTLTEGQPKLQKIVPVAGFNETELLTLASSLENNSEHPIAKAICSAAKLQGLKQEEISNFESIPGQGVIGTIKGQKILLGRLLLLQENGVDIEQANDVTQDLIDEANSTFYLAIDGVLAGLFAVSDPIKKTTPTAINAIKKLGVRVAMLSGDNFHSAKSVGKSLGIEEVFAELLPEDKIERIKYFQQHGEVVGFVGDGINDAPAISGADVGIAIGSGTDIAIESAEVVLMSGNLQGVVNAISLSRATMRNISENLFWAFGYNICLIPVAAGVLFPVIGVLLSPMFAAGAMAASSLFVVFNALRLKLFKPLFVE